MIAPYPLIFRPMLFEKVWGGRSLAALGKDLPEGKSIGESWELADLSSTSVSGGGGQAARSVIANGEMAGKTIQDALRGWGHQLMGKAPLSKSWGFPLLIKFLDARENLSVQVHPSPAFAALHRGDHVKSECWYILRADPGAVIYKGFKPGVTKESFERHVRDGTVVEDLAAVPAIAGDMHSLPSGTVHALGAGVVVAEVQTPSDTTFRLFDWGRTGREMHVEEGLKSAVFEAPPEATRIPEDAAEARLAATESFTIDGLRVGARGMALGAGCCAIIVVEGSCRLSGVRAEELGLGTTCLVPAGIAPACRVASEGGAVCLRIGVGRGA